VRAEYKLILFCSHVDFLTSCRNDDYVILDITSHNRGWKVSISDENSTSYVKYTTIFGLLVTVSSHSE
jgi:hypothetical protein